MKIMSNSLQLLPSLWILLLHGITRASSNVVTSNVTKSKKTIYIGAIIERMDVDIFTSRAAVVTALKLINNDNEALKDYHLVARFGNYYVSYHCFLNLIHLSRISHYWHNKKNLNLKKKIL